MKFIIADCSEKGRWRERKTNSLLERPGTITRFPLIMPAKAIFATASGVIPDVFLSAMPARMRNSVCVMPGQSTVTETPVFFNSARSEDEKEKINDLEAL